MSNWCTIESDPGVFSELIKGIGVKNIGVEEIYTFEDEYSIANLKPIHGLIFLFKWTGEHEDRECLTTYDKDLFFANQVIVNACATQAILATLLNCDQIDLGPELSNFKAFAKDMDSQMKGLAISNSELIRQVHNSFARPEPFDFGGPRPKKRDDDDLYHFISYVPFKGKLYELDGLQKGPILLGEYKTDDEWLEIAKKEINRRMEK
jgi:ubiquitin carboxyl-terminal hydrolase L5